MINRLIGRKERRDGGGRGKERKLYFLLFNVLCWSFEGGFINFSIVFLFLIMSLYHCMR